MLWLLGLLWLLWLLGLLWILLGSALRPRLETGLGPGRARRWHGGRWRGRSGLTWGRGSGRCGGARGAGGGTDGLSAVGAERGALGHQVST